MVDTNIVIAFLNGDKEIAVSMEESDEMLLSVVVLGELLYGARRSARYMENKEKVMAFSERCYILEINGSVAENYAGIRAALAEKGRPIPENDIWIAASCLSEDAILVSRDQHFEKIDALAYEVW
ncbi:MAG: type II toxin-antitoxin system VapC family toxin [Candidatus Latescibacterota bacterium]